MSVDLIQHGVEWNGVQTALGELRACHADYLAFFDGVFGELDTLGTELEAWQQASADGPTENRAPAAAPVDVARIETLLDSLSEQRTEVERLVRQSEQAQAQAAQTHASLAAELARLADVASGLAQPREAPSTEAPLIEAPSIEAWSETLTAVDAQCRQLQGAEASITAQLERLGQLAAEISESRVAETGLVHQWQRKAEGEMAQAAAQRDELVRGQAVVVDQLGRLTSIASELAEARQELMARCQQLEQQAAAAAADPADQQAEAQLRQQLHVMAEQHLSLEREHASLEMELDTVRARAAELSETLGAEKRFFAQQQTGWTDELQRMRRLLETLSDRAMTTAFAPTAPMASVKPAAKAAATAAAIVDDPVLDSVMSQFAMLQKDVTRRRQREES